MSLEKEFNVVDEAIRVATETLMSHGLPEDEAHVALLVRLSGSVSDEVAEIANMLRNDSDLLQAFNGETSKDFNVAEKL